MTTLTGRSTRTITGYLVTLLEYPRWLIDREVDFTNCHLTGTYDAADDKCMQCTFGEACVWLNQNRGEPRLDSPLPELLGALDTAVGYLRSEYHGSDEHGRHCDCDTCDWIREASNFLRTHRHKA
jgi:hypothetical protein